MNTVLLDHDMEKHKGIFVVNWRLNEYMLNKSLNYEEALKSGDVIREGEKIINHYRGRYGKHIVFAFSGMEATLFKDLETVVKALKDRNCQTAIETNVCRKTSYWERMTDLPDYITVNYKPLHDNFDQIISMTDYLRRRLFVQLNVQTAGENIAHCRRLLDQVSHSFDDVLITVQQMGADGETINEEWRKGYLELEEQSRERTRRLNLCERWYRGFMRSYRSDGQSKHLLPEEFKRGCSNRTRGWLCWAGLEQIFVTHNGHVFRGQCFQDWIGKISDISEFPSLPVNCQQESCLFSCDIMTKKQSQVYFEPNQIPMLASIEAFWNCYK